MLKKLTKIAVVGHIDVGRMFCHAEVDTSGIAVVQAAENLTDSEKKYPFESNKVKMPLINVNRKVEEYYPSKGSKYHK